MDIIDDLRQVRRDAVDKASIQHAETLDLLESLRDACGIAAYSIIESAQYKAEAEYWRGQFDKANLASIKHSEAMGDIMLKAALAGVFTPKERK